MAKKQKQNVTTGTSTSEDNEWKEMTFQFKKKV